MQVRTNTVPRRTAPAPSVPSPLQLCLAAAVKDDEMAMEFLSHRGRDTYIAVRLNQLAALELEQAERVAPAPADAVVSGRWA